MRTFGRFGFLLAVCLFSASLASAQTPPATLVVTSNGAPAANVEIFLYANGPKPRVATTNATGACDISETAFTSNALAVPAPGSSVTVWKRVCRDGRIEVILVPAGVNATASDLGCAESGAAAGDDCECTRVGVVIWGPSMRIDVGSLQPALGAGNSLGPMRLDLRGGVKFSSLGGGDTACDTIVSQLQDLGYNQNVACDNDGSGAGFAAGAGVVFPVAANAGLYAGVEIERLGSREHHVTDASRINVPGRPSNLIFSVDNTVDVTLFNVDVGASLTATDRVTITPYISFGRAAVESVVVDRLLGGPPGPTLPTQQVAGGTATHEKNSWGVGFGVRGNYRLLQDTWLYAQLQQRSISDVFEDDDPGRNPADLGTFGFVFGLGHSVSFRR